MPKYIPATHLTDRNRVEPGFLLKLPSALSSASVSSVSGESLEQTPVANLTNTLYGRISGLTVQQGSGEPGYDGAGFSIRGVGTYDNSSLTIYVDGFQTTSSYFQYLSPSEIESIAVLKDAASLAAFGMKGANGVLWVTTKRGQKSKPAIQISALTGFQEAINIDKPLDSYDYARLYNEAISNDNNGAWTPKYSDAQLQAYKNGTGTDVDWYKQVLKKSTPYTDASMVFSGGDTAAKYRILMDYMRDQGLYNVPISSTTSNARIQRYNIRANLDFNFFKIFESKIDMGGRIEDRRYPNFDGPTLWNNMATYPSNIYPVKDSTGNWSGTTIYPNNPVASLYGLGWAATHDRTLQANFNLKEKFDFITPGLYMNEAVSFNTWTRNSSSNTATYARYYDGVQTTTDKTTNIVANGTSPTDQYDWKQATITAGYDRNFGLHAVSAAVNYYASNYILDYGTNYSGNNFGNNIFYHYENVGGRLHYTYDNRYIAEFGFAASGSDYYAPGHRWGFYPALSGAWIISNESFLKEDKTISFLKLRASVGKTGYDASNQGRYLYQQYYGSNGSFYTGNNGLTTNSGIIQSYAANPDISAEHSMKYNAGIDATLLKKLDVTVDVFEDKRSGIVTMDNSYLAVFGSTPPYTNVGKVTNRGFDLSATYSDKTGNIGYFLGAMLSYAKNKIDYEAEIPPVNSFNAATGRPIGTPLGLIADGFYQTTDFNTDGSLKSGLAVPAFGTVHPGDIKYKDLDGNGTVDQNDITRIGNPSLPTLSYSFNAGLSYKGFDVQVFFQGLAHRTVNILSSANAQTEAFVNNGNAYSIAEGAWAYYPSQGIDTRATATYPRLTTLANNNNYRNSTFWEKSGDFLRLRNAEIGYNFPASLLRKIAITQLRIYINAVNPVTWSSLLKNYHLDPETLSGYPGLKSYNAGLSVIF
jgi:TonB-linked SusC/RagA family outer membrane protein